MAREVVSRKPADFDKNYLALRCVESRLEAAPDRFPRSTFFGPVKINGFSGPRKSLGIYLVGFLRVIST